MLAVTSHALQTSVSDVATIIRRKKQPWSCSAKAYSLEHAQPSIRDLLWIGGCSREHIGDNQLFAVTF